MKNGFGEKQKKVSQEKKLGTPKIILYYFMIIIHKHSVKNETTSSNLMIIYCTF